jgi:predicted flap endonuclease-1-like 5' DNA nuclease
MLRKSLNWVGLAVTWLATNAFTYQDQPTVTSSAKWAVLALLLVSILVVAILLILQRQKTPESLTRYHLDHAMHAYEDGEHALPEETVVAEATSSAPPAVEVEEATAPEEPRMAYMPLAPPEPDDLTKIEGIGPKISEILHAAGITRFDQLAVADVDKLHQLLKEAGPRFGLADPSHWPEQAGYLAAGDMEKFNALTDRLRGGHKIA